MFSSEMKKQNESGPKNTLPSTLGTIYVQILSLSPWTGFNINIKLQVSGSK